MEALLIQILRNQFTDMKVCLSMMTNRDRDELEHVVEYRLRLLQTQGLLNSIDPPHPEV